MKSNLGDEARLKHILDVISEVGYLMKGKIFIQNGNSI